MTIELLLLLASYLREQGDKFALDSPESDTFHDAADALDDARDLLMELEA